MKLKNLALAVVSVVSITILTTYIGCGNPQKKDKQEKTRVAGVIRVRISVDDANTARLWDNEKIKKISSSNGSSGGTNSDDDTAVPKINNGTTSSSSSSSSSSPRLSIGQQPNIEKIKDREAIFKKLAKTEKNVNDAVLKKVHVIYTDKDGKSYAIDYLDQEAKNFFNGVYFNNVGAGKTFAVVAFAEESPLNSDIKKLETDSLSKAIDSASKLARNKAVKWSDFIGILGLKGNNKKFAESRTVTVKIEITGSKNGVYSEVKEGLGQVVLGSAVDVGK